MSPPKSPPRNNNRPPSQMFLNAILGFFSNVLASAASNMLTRIHPLVLLGVGLCVGVWITYMIMKDPSLKKGVTEESVGGVVGEVVVNGLPALA